MKVADDCVVSADRGCFAAHSLKLEYSVAVQTAFA